MTKYIFITGGVISSLGKGIVAASLGSLIELRKIKLTFMKCDPYINIDPGTMNPYEHGEVFVTEDGAETDLDLGYYERFTNIKMSKENSLTSGQIYAQVISKERKGLYLGSTVQVIPHITNEIKSYLYENTKKFEVAIVEIGGTVGDIESLPFLEAIRQMKIEKGSNNVIFLHLTFVPWIESAGEIKTKPSQHSVKELRSIGIQPDILICRSKEQLLEKDINKLSLFTNVDKMSVICSPDLPSIYDLPKILHKQHLDSIVLKHFRIKPTRVLLNKWEILKEKINNQVNELNIAIIGKYVKLGDSYKSLNEAISHAGINKFTKINIKYIDSENLNDSNIKLLDDINGILIPGGFGNRGINGKILAAKYAREKKIPFLGICLGLQVAIIEFCRNVLDLKNANSTEFDKKASFPIIALMEAWVDINKNLVSRKTKNNLGGSMRLGKYKCTITKNRSLARIIYNKDIINERHRHRYEVNTSLIGKIMNRGLIVSGKSKYGNLVEIIEIPKHPWYLCCQFHPEFSSKPQSPHPIFLNYIEAMLKKQKNI